MSLRVRINASDKINGGATTINWLLDKGAHVTISGLKGEARIPLERSIEEHLRRVARDGKAYDKMKSRLVWSSEKLEASDIYGIFVSNWKKKIIGVVGKDTYPAVMWAAHLIGNAVAGGYAPDRPLLSMVGNRARLAIVDLRGRTPSSNNPIVNIGGLTDIDAAIKIAVSAGVSDRQIQQRITDLPKVPFSRKVIHKSGSLIVINDSFATNPSRGVAALGELGGPNCVLIAGGDDRGADYKEWATMVKKTVRPTNLIFLSGTATVAMRKALGSNFRGIRAYDSLEQAWEVAHTRAGKYVQSVILFSPSAKDFSSFEDEVDRGRSFDSLVRESLK